MRVVSKEKSYVHGYEPSENLIAQAVKELTPKWARFEGEMENYQWPWEFASRNPGYQADGPEAVQAWRQWALDDKPESLARALELSKKISDKYGVILPLPVDAKMIHEGFWNEGLNGKFWSQIKVKRGLTAPGKILIEPSVHEVVWVIDLNTPRQTYERKIAELYAEKQGLYRPLFQFQIDKFPQYLKVYDLRTWGEQNDRSIKGKDGKMTSCISWADISQCLFPLSPPSVQTIKGQYNIAVEFINGGYKNFIKYKC